jgi:hypothetical protein
LGELVDIKFFGELTEPSEFSEEFLTSFLANGYAVEQLIDGVTYIRMTSKYYEELGEYIVKHPKELCRDYWIRLVDDTKHFDIMDFIKRFCEVHSTIKKLTNDEVDFCLEIMEEL